MIYRHTISNTESEDFFVLMNVITGKAKLPQELNRPIRAIVMGEYYLEPSQWAGNGELNFAVPYLAGKGDLIAFDFTKSVTAKFQVEYDVSYGATNILAVVCEAGSSEQELYPLLATLMHAANDIDVSDDNFRAWLINNRPKVNKMEKMELHENDINAKLFEFLQLREHAWDVKITQETGQALFAALFAHAEAIAHEEVSGDGAPTDSAQLVLALVNNLINSAKPAPAKPPLIIKMALDYFIEKNAAYMKQTGLSLLSGENCYIAGVDEADARRVFGDPVPSMISQKAWYFKIYGIVCCLYSSGNEMVLNIARGTLLNMRKKVADDVTKMLMGSE